MAENWFIASRFNKFSASRYYLLALNLLKQPNNKAFSRQSTCSHHILYLDLLGRLVVLPTNAGDEEGDPVEDSEVTGRVVLNGQVTSGGEEEVKRRTEGG